MDRRLSGRFFKVVSEKDNKNELHSILHHIGNIPKVRDRQQFLSQNFVMRLEHYELSDDFIHGDICRKQTDNVPPEVSDEGLSAIPLQDGSGIGHLAAFQYHIPTRILLIQSNRQCGVPNRLSDYVRRFFPGNTFGFEPVPNENAWERANRATIRSFTVRMAVPDNVTGAEIEGASGMANLARMAHIHDASIVEITFSSGRKRKNYLAKSKTLGFAKELIDSALSIDKMELRSSNEFGSDLIDFLEDHMRFSEEIDLPERNPLEHYVRRKEFLDKAFSDKISWLKERYGK